MKIIILFAALLLAVSCGNNHSKHNHNHNNENCEDHSHDKHCNDHEHSTQESFKVDTTNCPHGHKH